MKTKVDRDAVVIIEWNGKTAIVHPDKVECCTDGALTIHGDGRGAPLICVAAGLWRKSFLPGRWVYLWGEPLKFEIAK